MRRVLKWTGIVLGSVAGLIVIAAVAVYFISNARLNKVYDLALAPLEISSDSVQIARGRHIVTVRGCVDCHGDDFSGKVFMDDPAIGQLWASNLTTGNGGVASAYQATDWDRAIRHGVRPDGKPLLFMPSQEYHILSDEDLAAAIAYITSMPPVDNVLPASEPGPVARVLHLTGVFPLLPAEMIDHAAPRAPAPPAGPTAEYGAYLATSCVGCHGDGYSGGPIPGAPPSMPVPVNITAHMETGIGTWTKDDFFHALRQGKRPDGTDIDPFMPWKLTAQMTDDELSALWEYLLTLPPMPEGNR